MPVLSRFCGVVIRMMFIRPFQAHFHAFYGDSDMDIPRPEHARRRRRRRIIVGCLVLFGFALATLALTRLTIPPVLLGAAVAACWLPARRAARVDPLVALRSE